MYQFRDITAGAVTESLPAEAVKFILDDGTEYYLENQIAGYQTLYVGGRETLEKELTTYDDTRADGSLMNYSRYGARTLTVGFQLVAASNSAFRTAFNTLNKLLNVEEVKIIVADESDKYFVGTPVFEESPDAGRNSVVGEFSIYCADPFKYAVNEEAATYLSTIPLTDGADAYDSSTTYEVGDECVYNNRLYLCNTEISTAEEWTASHWDAVSALGFQVNNQGGYKAYPRFVVTFDDDTGSDGSIGTVSDCGYVAFYKNDASIQFGDDAEKQTVSVNRFSKNFTACTFANSGFSNASSDTTVPGTAYKDRGQASCDSKGMVAKYGTKASSDSSYWHGSYVTRATVSERDFIFNFTPVFALANGKSAKKQKGLFRVMVLGANDTVIAAVELFKSSATSTKGTARYYKGTTLMKSKTVDFKYTGDFGFKKKNNSYVLRGKSCDIKRSGEDLTIQLACDKQPFTIDMGDDETSVTKVAFFFGQYGTAAVPFRNVLRKASFIDSDVGNTFTANQVLEVDCSDASVYLDDMEALGLGDISNDWSQFYLDVGSNVIYTQWSDWTDLAGHPPTPVLYYRKRWI